MCDMHHFHILVTEDDERLEPQTPVLHDVGTVMDLVHQGDEGGRHLAGTHGAHVLCQNTPMTVRSVVKETAAPPD